MSKPIYLEVEVLSPENIGQVTTCFINTEHIIILIDNYEQKTDTHVTQIGTSDGSFYLVKAKSKEVMSRIYKLYMDSPTSI